MTPLSMRLKITTLLALILLPITLLAFPIEKPDGYLLDQTGLLTSQQRQTIEQASQELNEKTTIEVATVVINTMGDSSIEEIATQIFEQWGIGKKGKNNGILFVIAPKEKKMRIEVGYGLEDILTDGTSGMIRDNYVLPYFRDQKIGEGIINGHLAICTYLAKSQNIELSLTPHRIRSIHQRSTQGSLGIIILFICILLVAFSRGGRGSALPWLLLGGLLGGGGNRDNDFGSFGGSGFGGFGGGSSGGGGASGSW